MGDVDILVRDDDYARAGNILAGMGFVPLPYTGNNASVFHKKFPVEIYIDLHHSLSNEKSPAQKKIFDPDIARLWQNAVPVSGSIKALKLGPEDELIYLCFHILKERFSDDKWFKDLAGVIKKNRGRIDGRELMRTAGQYGTCKLCVMVLRYMRENYRIGIDFIDTGAEAMKFRFFGLEYRIFSFILGRKIFPLREFLWPLCMDSSGKKFFFLIDAVKYAFTGISARTRPKKVK